MMLDDVFQFLHDNGLARSHAIFSTHYLGHSSRYFDYLRCSSATPSLKSQIRLAMHLTDLGRVRQGGVISAVAVGHRQAALAVMCRG
jgi:hypothetical protein